MKLVIDIPEEEYEILKDVNELGGEWKTDITSRSMKAIANGTPLPKRYEWITVSDRLPEDSKEEHTAKWIKISGDFLCACSSCGDYAHYPLDFNYCPNCGAEIVGVIGTKESLDNLTYKKLGWLKGDCNETSD